MAPATRPPSLLLTTAPPARAVPSSSRITPPTSNSPFRYVRLDDPLAPPPPPRASIDHPLARSPPRLSPVTPASPLFPAAEKHAAAHPHAHPPPPRAAPLPPQRARGAPLPPPAPAPPRGRPQGFRIPARLAPWLGVGAWAATSAAVLLAVAFWRAEVFAALDRLAAALRARGAAGYAILFCLIFITTIPPVPLYSTLIVLSGYAFGTWAGAAVSYAAALAGAVCVFAAARRVLGARLARLLGRARALQRAVRAVERRPRLLLLVRVAPYPYNVLNVLLAGAEALPLRTFAGCTALSLVKVVVHTSVGASLQSFGAGGGGDGAGGAGAGLGRAWAAAGAVLCVGLFVYLGWVARGAVDAALAAEEGARGGAAEMREAAT